MSYKREQMQREQLPTSFSDESGKTPVLATPSYGTCADENSASGSWSGSSIVGDQEGGPTTPSSHSSRQLHISSSHSSPEQDQTKLAFHRGVPLKHGDVLLNPTCSPLDAVNAAARQCDTEVDDVEDVFPCTPAQRGIVFASLQQANAYWFTKRYHLKLDFSKAHFGQCWKQLCRHVPLLRARMVYLNDGEVHHAILRTPSPCTFVDQGLAAGQQGPACDLRFKIGHGLARAVLLKDGLFLFQVHHSIADGTSLVPTMECFADFLVGSTPSPGVSFTGVVKYCQQLSAADSCREWWRKHLSGAPGPLPVPNHAETTRKRALETREYTISYPTTREFTLTTYARAAFGLLLGVYADTTDVVFGAVASARRQSGIAGIDKIHGPTLATVPFRISWERQTTTGALLRAVQDTTSAMADVEQVGIENIRAWLPERDRASCQLDNILVVQRDDMEIDSHVLQSLPDVAPMEVLHSLNLELIPITGSKLRLRANFDTRTLEASFVGRLMDDLFSALQKLMLLNRGSEVAQAVEATEQDKAIIFKRNERLDVPNDTSIPVLVEQSVAAFPDRLSVDAHDGRWSYAELWAVSGNIVAGLASWGVSPGASVAVVLQKSKWAVATMLAILRLGAHCVPLAPDSPQSRVDRIVRATGLHHIVVSDYLIPSFNFTTDSIRVPQELQQAGRGAVVTPTLHVSPNDTAFVMFSSGTTGEPKGIVISHRAFATSVAAHAPLLRINSRTRALHFSAYTFDHTLWECFSVLSQGGCICVPSETERLSDLAGYMARERVTWAFITATIAEMLDPAELPCLETLGLGGEPVPRRILDRWASRKNLVTGYGPTECSYCLHATSPPVTGHIGLPTTACCAWVVHPDDSKVLVPLNAIGELVVEGFLLADCYCSDAPLGVSPWLAPQDWLQREECRVLRPPMFRTGDLVRRNVDGTFQLIGRKDTMIKLHGQRVDLAAIEDVIARESGMSVAVDVIQHNALGESRQQLVCFFGHEHARDQHGTLEWLPNIQKSRKFASLVKRCQDSILAVMPPFMVPSAYLAVSRLLRTSSGKLDRSKIRLSSKIFLPEALVVLDRAMTLTVEPPASEAENVLQKSWSDVLRVSCDDIGRQSHFFRMGGDSVAAIRLAVSLRRREQGILTVEQILKNPVLAAQALLLQQTVDPLCGHARPAALPSLPSPAPFELLSMVDGPELEALIDRAAFDLNVDAAEIEDIYPASPLQEALWALSARREGAYRINTTFKLLSHEDAEFLQACWRQAANHLPILRTALVVLPAKGTLAVVLKTAAQSPRMLASVDLDGTRLTWNIHHAAYDGAAWDMILETVMAYWQHQKPRSFLPHSIFVQHLQMLESKRGKQSRMHWYSELGSEIFQSFPIVTSPTGMSSPSREKESSFERPEYKGDFLFASLLEAAFAILLSRHANAQRVVFGDVQSGRSHPAVDPYLIAGPTVFTVPMAVNVEPSSSIKEFLESIHNQIASTAEYGQIGLANIRSYLPQTFQGNVDFQSLLAIQSPESQTVREARDLWNTEADLTSFYTHALLFSVTPGQDTIHVEAHFDPSVISEAYVEQMLTHYARICTALATASDETCCRDIEITRVADAAPQIHSVQDDQSDFVAEAHGASIESIIADFAKRQPDACAVSAWDGSLTYRELVECADIIAQELLEHDVTRGDCMAIAFEKGHIVPVLMLASLQAGMHFLLLDAAQPIARLQTQLELAQARMMLCSSSQRDRFHDFLVRRPDLIVLDPTCSLKSTPARVKSSHRALPTVEQDDDAYVIFTSGTTGTPKGIRITHRNITTAICSITRSLGMTRNAAVLQYSRYSWDVSILDILGTLIVGARLCIPPESTLLSPPGLEAFIRHERVTVLIITPTVARFIRPESVLSVETIALAGEQMTSELQKRWSCRARLFNTYGPAECSIIASVSLIGPDTSPVRLQNIDACRLWVVNPRNAELPAPPGTDGELLIEGPIVGRGYLGAGPGGFCQSPSWLTHVRGGVQSWVYRTGDIVRLGLDGGLEYIGRKDSQIKINGQRVELLEIESAVKKALPEFETVVEVFKSNQGSTAIVAFVCCTPTTVVDQDRLEELVITKVDADRLHDFTETIRTVRDTLELNLLQAAIPGVFVPLSALPVLSSGKIQRSVLRQFKLDSTASRTRGKVVTSSGKLTLDPIECCLRQLWAKVLGLDPDLIGIEDEFSGLGGESIRAMHLAAQPEFVDWGLDISDIFKHKTILGLAAVVKDRKTKHPSVQVGRKDDTKSRHAERVKLAAELLRVDERDIEDIYPCTALQSELIALSARDPGTYWATFSFPETLHGRDCNRFRNVWASAEALAPILRTRIVLLGDEDEPMQAVLAKGQAIPITEQGVLLDSAGSYSLTNGAPLIHTSFVPVPGGHIFRLKMHHSVYDGAFMQLLAQTIGNLFDGRIVEPLSSFRDFILDHGDNSQDSHTFWRTQLDGIRPLPWPARPADRFPQTDAVTHASVCLSKSSNGEAISTSTSVVRAAWAIVMAICNEAQDITFAEVLSGRVSNSSNAARAAGPTLTTVPVRVSISDADTVRDLVADIQGYYHRILPFQQMGLHRITSSMSDNDRLALSLSSLLVVNIETEHDLPGHEQAMSWDYEKSGPLRHPYPLVLDCTLTSTMAKLMFLYDSSLMDEMQVIAVSDLLSATLLQLMNVSHDSSVEQLKLPRPQSLAYALEDLGEERLISNKDNSLEDAVKSEAPLSPIALKLRDVWCAVLKKEAHSIDGPDNFFRCGGNSISAIRLSSGARAMHLDLSVVQIFRNPTLESMAAIASTLVADPSAQPACPSAFGLLDKEHTDSILHIAAAACDIHKQDIEDAYPCTPMQKAMLAASEAGQQVAYVQTRRFLLSSDVDVPRLFRALIHVIQERPILRTRVVNAGVYGLCQVVVRPHLCRPSFVSDAEDAEETLVDVYGRALNQFIITDTTLIWIAHHATYDGDSQALIEHDIAESYAGGCAQSGVPFHAFVEHLTRSQDKHAETAFWSSYLAGCNAPAWPVSSFVTKCEDDHPQFGHCDYQFPLPSSGSMDHTGLTQVKLALALLLRRYTQSDHVMFATVLAGRESTEQLGDGQILGPTLATVPIHVVVNEADSLYDAMDQIQRGAADMITFQHTGLSKIRDLVRSEVDLSPERLTLLVIQPESDGQANRLQTIGLQELMVGTPTMHSPEFPLVVESSMCVGRIILRIHHNTTMISRDEADLFASQLAHIIGILRASQSQKSVASLDLVSLAEKTVLADWSGPESKDDLPTPLDRLKIWAGRYPQACAVNAWDGDITYSDLVTQSGRLAMHLSSRGVSPSSTVAFCLNRSKMIIVLMYAVWQIGAAWTPFDSRDPEVRMQALYEKLGANLFVTNLQHLSDLLPGRTMFLEDDFDANTLPSMVTCDESSDESAAESEISRPAYILFTSGSTGTPKGVVISQKAIAASAGAAGVGLGVEKTSRVLQLTRLTFDPSVHEIVATLYHGGCVCVPHDDECNDDLFETAARYRASLVSMTPSVLRRQPIPSSSGFIKRLILGGEQVRPSVLSPWLEQLPGYGIYGLTETTIANACGPICLDKSQTFDGSVLPRPFSGRFWIVAENSDNCPKLVPRGCPGELLIEGPILADGYWQDVEQTSKAFVSVWTSWPFDRGDSGSKKRLFRTGDRARHLHDGSVQLIGRIDHQVKVSGQRVELGEVEHWLAKALPNMTTIVEPVPHRNVPQPRLTIFVVHAQAEKSSQEAQFLHSRNISHASERAELLDRAQNTMRQHLSAYMIPNCFYYISQVPLNRTGKRDRATLAKWTQAIDYQPTMELLPVYENDQQHFSNNHQCELKLLWAEVLDTNVHQISSESSFTDLGGDSISAMRLVSLARKHGMNMLVRQVLATPRLREMAQLPFTCGGNLSQEEIQPFTLVQDAAQEQIKEAVNATCGLSWEAVEDAYPLTDMQDHYLRLSLAAPGDGCTQFSFSLKRGSNDMSIALVQNAVRRVCVAHQSLRTYFVACPGNTYYQVVLSPDLVSQEPCSVNTESLRHAQESEAEALHQPLGTSTSRFAIFCEAGQPQLLIFTANHAIYDGWSLLNLAKELQRALNSSDDSVVISPPEYFMKQTIARSIQCRTSSASTNFWTQHLATAAPKALHSHDPTKDPRPLATASLREEWPMPPRHATGPFTLSTILHVALATSLRQITASPTPVIETITTGRGSGMIGITEFIGPAVTRIPFCIPLRDDLGTELPLNKVLKRVQLFLHAEATLHEHYGMNEIAALNEQNGRACRAATTLVVHPTSLLMDEDEGKDIDGQDSNMGASRSLQLRQARVLGKERRSLVIECTPQGIAGTVRVEVRFDIGYFTDGDAQRLMQSFREAFEQCSAAAAS